jgi:hypothetical protein
VSGSESVERLKEITSRNSEGNLESLKAIFQKSIGDFIKTLTQVEVLQISSFHADKMTEDLNIQSKMNIVDDPSAPKLSHSTRDPEEQPISAPDSTKRTKPLSTTFVSVHSTPCPEPENTPQNRIQQTQHKAKAQALFQDFDCELKVQ